MSHQDNFFFFLCVNAGDCRAPAAACNVLTDLCVSSSSGGSTTNSNGATDLVLPETLEQKKNCKRSASSGTKKIKKEPPDSAVPQEDCNTQKNSICS